MNLKPKGIRLTRDGKGIQVVIDGIPQRVERIARAFPKTNPDRYIGLMGTNGHEIGMIRNPKKLDAMSWDLLQAELKHIYFVPEIQEILAVEAKGTGSLWKVTTDDGERTFRIQDRGAIDGSRPPMLSIRDENGKRYRIENFWDLDRESRDRVRGLLPEKVLKARYGGGGGHGHGGSGGSGGRGGGGGRSSMGGGMMSMAR